MRIDVYSQELTGEVKAIQKESSGACAVQMVLHSDPLRRPSLHPSPTGADSAVTFWLPESAEQQNALACTFEAMAREVRAASNGEKAPTLEFVTHDRLKSVADGDLTGWSFALVRALAAELLAAREVIRRAKDALDALDAFDDPEEPYGMGTAFYAALAKYHRAQRKTADAASG